MDKEERRKQFYKNSLDFIKSLNSINKAYRQGLWTLDMLQRKRIRTEIIYGVLLYLGTEMIVTVVLCLLLEGQFFFQ